MVNSDPAMTSLCWIECTLTIGLLTTYYVIRRGNRGLNDRLATETLSHVSFETYRIRIRYANVIFMPPAVGVIKRYRDQSVCPSVRPSVCPSLGYSTLAACSWPAPEMCGRRTYLRSDVDPPRVELPSAEAYYLLAAPGTTTCSIRAVRAAAAAKLGFRWW